MATTTFQDYNQNTPIVASWLNDVNKNTYSAGGVAKTALESAAAWVRFSVSSGVPTVQQSANILSVTRLSQGIFLITYLTNLTNASNCYSISQATSGFQFPSAETPNSVTVTFTNTANTSTDPVSASVTIFGAN